MNGTLFGIVVLFQMALLALSNGFNTTVAFSLAPQEVPQHLIGKSGSCISFFLICGIAFGAMFALFVTQTILIWRKKPKLYIDIYYDSI